VRLLEYLAFVAKRSAEIITQHSANTPRCESLDLQNYEASVRQQNGVGYLSDDAGVLRLGPMASVVT
jgi:hypothetical protein